MATNAATQGTVFALRRQIAKIEGRLAERLEERSDEAAAGSDIVLRQHGIAAPAGGLLPTGVEDLDAGDLVGPLGVGREVRDHRHDPLRRGVDVDRGRGRVGHGGRLSGGQNRST